MASWNKMRIHFDSHWFVTQKMTGKMVIPWWFWVFPIDFQSNLVPGKSIHKASCYQHWWCRWLVTTINHVVFKEGWFGLIYETYCSWSVHSIFFRDNQGSLQQTYIPTLVPISQPYLKASSSYHKKIWVFACPQNIYRFRGTLESY
jgi:hypothetical protein